MIGIFLAVSLFAAALHATYSIVAWDGEEMGVAVQSHWYSVGTVVSWAEPGLGVVATQSFSEIAYGPLGLQLLNAGYSPADALTMLLAADPQREARQVALLDISGRVAAHTGNRCIPKAGHIEGDHFSVQANLMMRDTVWSAMAEAFRSSEGQPLAERLIQALEAAEGEGGDIRGRQSAALRVVKVKPQGAPWKNVVVDIRVDDSTEPLAELRRIWGVHRTYDAMNAGDEALASGDVSRAMKMYEEAAALSPDNVEVRFWQGVTLWESGEKKKAMAVLQPILEKEEAWREVLIRLPEAGLFSKEDVWDIIRGSVGKTVHPPTTSP